YVVTLCISQPGGKQVYLNVGFMRSRTEKIMPYQAIEVIGRGCSNVNLKIGHLLDGTQENTDIPRNRRCLLESRSLRHIDHNLELALVVKRQHFHRHQTECKQGHGE